MKEHPITYSPAMVRAKRVGLKTQTRRILSLPKWAVPGAPIELGDDGNPLVISRVSGCRSVIHCPYGTHGDRLWTREAWRLPVTLDEFSGSDVAFRTTLAGGRVENLPILYDADQVRRNWNGDFEVGRYRHARFMPRWAGRDVDEVVSVRVERLTSISNADAIAEGIHQTADCGDEEWAVENLDYLGHSPIESYCELIEDIHGPGIWDANPWVWVIEFKRAAS